MEMKVPEIPRTTHASFPFPSRTSTTSSSVGGSPVLAFFSALRSRVNTTVASPSIDAAAVNAAAVRRHVASVALCPELVRAIAAGDVAPEAWLARADAHALEALLKDVEQ